MKTIIKLAVAALFLNGMWQLGTTYWTFYEFKDAVQDAADFSADKSRTQIEDRVRELADRHDIHLDADSLSVRKERTHTYIDASYVQTIELVPRYPYPWRFKVSVDGWTNVWLEEKK